MVARRDSDQFFRHARFRPTEDRLPSADKENAIAVPSNICIDALVRRAFVQREPRD